MEQKVKIKTSSGVGYLDKFWVSELGFLMVRVDLGGRFVTFNLGIHDVDNNIFSNLF